MWLLFSFRFLFIVYSGKVQTPPEESRWMTSKELFLCILKAASGNGSNFAQISRELVSVLANFFRELISKCVSECLLDLVTDY